MTGPSHPRTFVRRTAGLAGRARAVPEVAAGPGTVGGVPAAVEPAPAPARPSPRPRPAPADAAPAGPSPVPASAVPVAAPEPAVVAPPVAAPAVPVAAPEPAVAAPPVSGPPAAAAAPPPAERRPRRRVPFWLLKPLVGLVIAVVALLVMVELVTDDDDTTAPVVAPSSVSTAVAAPPATGGAQAGTLTVGDVFLLPLSTATDSAGSLAARSGQVVQAQGVQVLSTPTAGSAWIGTSSQDRVYVLLVGSSDAAVALAPGQRVSFTGTMVVNGDGLAAGDGAELLARQGQHVQVFPAALTAA